jgi:hypothetical protein
MSGRKRGTRKKRREDRAESVAFAGGVATRLGRFIEISWGSNAERSEFLQSYTSTIKQRAEDKRHCMNG